MPHSVAGIWRYPVKSMLGESLTECEVGPDGLLGDRAFALVDNEDGTVASAKNPRKWGVLLDCRATFAGDPADGIVEITVPDGSTVRSDDPEVDARLSAVVDRDVRLASTAPDHRTFEEVWPDIDGLAPEDVIASSNIGMQDGERLSRLPLGLAAPPGTFFDLAVLHVLTTATLARLSELDPKATFDVRRYRPNVLVDCGDGAGFEENGWTGRTVALGPVQMSVSMPTMRCVMTTLPQQDLPRDRQTLRTIAAHNRLEITGLGEWACAGVYGNVAVPGRLRVGEPVTLVDPPAG